VAERMSSGGRVVRRDYNAQVISMLRGKVAELSGKLTDESLRLKERAEVGAGMARGNDEAEGGMRMCNKRASEKIAEAEKKARQETLGRD